MARSILDMCSAFEILVLVRLVLFEYGHSEMQTMIITTLRTKIGINQQYTELIISLTPIKDEFRLHPDFLTEIAKLIQCKQMIDIMSSTCIKFIDVTFALNSQKTMFPSFTI
eukprot:762822-Hanusia_phi.AAC.13